MIVGNLRHGTVIPLEIGAVTEQGVVQTVKSKLKCIMSSNKHLS